MNSLLEDTLNLFGLQIKQKEPKQNLSGQLATDTTDDGAAQIISTNLSGAFGSYLDQDGQIKSEQEAIRKYREISLYPEVDIALQDIVNEAIPQEQETKMVKLCLDELEDVSETTKSKFGDEFKTVLKLLDYDERGSELFKKWYVDGRLAFQIIVDKNSTSTGIQKLVLLDAQNVKKVKEVTTKKTLEGANVIDKVEEYFIYSSQGYTTGKSNTPQNSTNVTTMKISPDAIIFVPSGIVDQANGMVLSYLHKAIRPINQLRMLEDATVVYFIARAPERRVFYVDVGNLPKLKAEQYLKSIMNNYRNKIVYDAKTGCFSMDTLVPLLDGRTLSIKEISEELKSGKKLWSYSCHPTTGRFAPGLITWAGVTREESDVLKITLDNGKEIICTYDHKFPVWGKGKTEAKDLIVGDSMIPFYTREEYTTTNSSYQQIFDNELKKWIFTHRLVSQWKDEHEIANEYLFNEQNQHERKMTVHHMNYKRCDNTPDNLVRMSRKDHFDYHKQHCSFAGKLGGEKTKRLKLGIHAQTKEEQSLFGKRLVEQKIGLFDPKYDDLRDFWRSRSFNKLTPEELHEISTKGGQRFKELLKDDEFRIQWEISKAKGWTQVHSNNARDRANSRGKEFLKNMQNLGRIALLDYWNGEFGEIHKGEIIQRQSVSYPDSLIDIVKLCATNNLTIDESIGYVNSNYNFDNFKELNKGKYIHGKGKTTFEFIRYNDISRISKLQGYENFKNMRKELHSHKNHKIVKIEYLNEKIDVGTLTIDGDEKYHNYHTFALDAGIYTFNSTMNDKKYLSVLDDFWMPRRDGGKGTEITSLPGAQNITGYLDSLGWFKDKMYEALNIPKSRLQSEGGFNVGRSTEISRDEVKFQKFIDRLRNKFGQLLIEALKTQLILKGIVNTEEWEEIKPFIKLDFQKDNFFSELKNQEILQSRFTMLQQVDSYLQKYVTKDWVQKNVLMLSDDDIKAMDKQMKKEENDPTAQPDWKIQMLAQTGGIQPQSDEQTTVPQSQGNQTTGSEPEYDKSNY